LQGLLEAALLVAGTKKLAGSQMQVTFFEKISLGQWFRYFTGGLEVIGAILVLVPRTAVVGAVLLGMTMVGAVNIHLLITGGSPVSSVVLLVIAVAVTWYRELYLKRRQ
jgi:putative oxidoreductase